MFLNFYWLAASFFVIKFGKSFPFPDESVIYVESSNMHDAVLSLELSPDLLPPPTNPKFGNLATKFERHVWTIPSRQEQSLFSSVPPI